VHKQKNLTLLASIHQQILVIGMELTKTTVLVTVIPAAAAVIQVVLVMTVV